MFQVEYYIIIDRRICYELKISMASLHKLDIGLDQKLSMPEDSYLIDYFETMSESLEVGAPVYFVIKV